MRATGGCLCEVLLCGIVMLIGGVLHEDKGCFIYLAGVAAAADLPVLRDDAAMSKEPDGAFNEEYCKWCYADGAFRYTSPQQLIDFCVEHMASEQWPAEQVRAHMEAVVPNLKHWKE